MYCEKIGITMKESTCLRRYTFHHLLPEEKENTPWFKQSSEACRLCVQGKKVYMEHLKGSKKGEDMDENKIKMKKCSKCGKEKPATKEYFWGNKNNKDGLHLWCKKCGMKAKGVTDQKKSKKKSSKKAVVAKKPDTKVFLNKVGAVKKASIITLDFTEHEDLLADIEEAADEYYRSPEKQIMWWLVTRDNPAMRDV